MRNTALILLLLMLLAPRLGAAMPHALACADLAPAEAAVSTRQEPAHAHHQASPEQANGHHGGHHEHSPHHGQKLAADDIKSNSNYDSTSSDNNSSNSSDNDGDCRHCGQCDEHCSAIVLSAVSLPGKLHVSDRLVSNAAEQRAGIANDLNRPPRTTLS